MNQKVPAHQAPYESINVTFSHPNITDKLGRVRPLVVETGMDGVSWDYNLNTQKQQTYGGEVIQILSANIGQLTIKGTCRDYTELDAIYAWFKEYMFNLRQEHVSSKQRPVTVSYPHRGWKWEVYIVDAPGYHLGRQVVAPEWQVVCEFFHPEDRDLLSAETRNEFTEVLHTNTAVPKEILHNYNGIYSSPFPTMGEGANQSGIIDTVTREEMASVLGDNFQNMIGAWNTGDFGRFAFDVTGTDKRTQNIFKSSEDYYKSIYGTNVIANLTKAATSGTTPAGTPGAFTANWPGDSAPDVDRANWLGAKGREAGLPDELLVMAALTEGSMRSGQSVRFSDADSVGLFQIRIGIHSPSEIGDSAAQAHWSSWTNIQKAEYWEIADNSVKWFVKGALAKKSNYPAPYDKHKLGQWCQAVEISAFPDRYEANYDKARTLLAHLNEYIASQSTSTATGPSGGTRDQIVSAAQLVYDNRSHVIYSERGDRWEGITNHLKPPLYPVHSDCSSYVSWCYWVVIGGGPDILNGSNWSGGFTGSQTNHGRKISIAQLKPADLVFYGASGGSGISHVAMYAGNGKVFTHGHDPVGYTDVHYRQDLQECRTYFN